MRLPRFPIALITTGLWLGSVQAQDGTEKWRFSLGASVTANTDKRSSPAISADGTVYVGSNDTNLYAVNPDGTEKWRLPTGDMVLSSPAIGTDGTIYVGSNDTNLYAVNPDGTEKWRFPTGDIIWSSAAIGTDGTVYVGSNDTNFYAVNPDGTGKWSFRTNSIVRRSLALGEDGIIYVSSDDGFLYAINVDGTEKWRFSTRNSAESSPAIGADGTIYVGNNGTALYAINPDGTEKWRFEPPASFRSSPALGKTGTIYVGSGDGNLYAFNPDGSEKWRFFTEASVRSSPAIAEDGTVYVVAFETLYAVNSSSGGLADSPWPMFHHDPCHTGRVGGGVCEGGSVTNGDEPGAHKLYFAQFGNGAAGEITLESDIVLPNPSATDTASGTVDFFNADGSPFATDIEGQSIASSVNFMVPPLASTTISTTGQGEFGTGTAVVSSDRPLAGVIRFQISAPAGVGSGIAGVPASQVVSGFVTPARRVAGGINTGVAIRNVETNEVNLNLSLRGNNGVEVPSGSAARTITGNGQLVDFINGLFPNADTSNFVGSVVVISDGMIAATALEQGVNAGEFTTLPVTPLPTSTIIDWATLPLLGSFPAFSFSNTLLGNVTLEYSADTEFSGIGSLFAVNTLELGNTGGETLTMTWSNPITNLNMEIWDIDASPGTPGESVTFATTATATPAELHPTDLWDASTQSLSSDGTVNPNDELGNFTVMNFANPLGFNSIVLTWNVEVGGGVLGIGQLSVSSLNN